MRLAQNPCPGQESSALRARVAACIKLALFCYFDWKMSRLKQHMFWVETVSSPFRNIISSVYTNDTDQREIVAHVAVTVHLTDHLYSDQRKSRFLFPQKHFPPLFDRKCFSLSSTYFNPSLSPPPLPLYACRPPITITAGKAGSAGNLLLSIPRSLWLPLPLPPSHLSPYTHTQASTLSGAQAGSSDGSTTPAGRHAANARSSWELSGGSEESPGSGTSPPPLPPPPPHLGPVWSLTAAAAWLLREVASGQASPFHPYLRLLPAYVPLPFFFPRRVLAELQDAAFVRRVSGSAIVVQCIKSKASVAVDFWVYLRRGGSVAVPLRPNA